MSNADGGETIDVTIENDELVVEILNAPEGPQGIQGPVGPVGPQGPSGASTWDAISGKPTTVAGYAISDAVVTTDARLYDAREWIAETVSQAEAEAGSATTRRAWTAQRVAQAIAAWWSSSSAKTKLDGIAPNATANATDAELRDRSTHTGTQAIATVSGLQAALDAKQAAGSYATLDGGGKVPASLLPSYVDDVIEAASLAAFPATGETGKIYVATGAGKAYRWTGSAYVEIVASPGSTDAVPEGSVNLYFTNGRASAAAPVQSVAGRTGEVTLSASDVGLSSAILEGDSRLTDAREWSAATVTQAEAEAGTDTGRKAWSVLRVWQAISAWWATTDAPNDGDTYARNSAGWIYAPADPPPDGNSYLRCISGVTPPYARSWVTIDSWWGSVDAASDGSRYARKNGAWEAFDAIPEPAADGTPYSRTVSIDTGSGSTASWVPAIPEPPADSAVYARTTNGASESSWVPVMPEPPDDGIPYSRMTLSGASSWVQSPGEEPPPDETLRARRNSAANVAAWVALGQQVFVQDTEPAPVESDGVTPSPFVWFKTDAGRTKILDILVQL